MIQWFRDRQAPIFAFLIVLLLMPLGHTLMVLNEQVLHTGKYPGAIALGLIGAALLVWGIRSEAKPVRATLLGLIAGVLVWTGWVEFSFVWVSEKLAVAPYVVDGEVKTKPEYLVMLSSLGLLASFTLFFLIIPTRCLFFMYFQRLFGLRRHLKTPSRANISRPMAVITFIETMTIIWFFYILLLVVYDPDIAGDQHPITYLVALGSLLWSLYLIRRLLRFRLFDAALRYAVPTVVIFWNVVEILGRWDFYKEVWVHPSDYVVFNTGLFLIFIGFIAHTLINRVGVRRKKSFAPAEEKP